MSPGCNPQCVVECPTFAADARSSGESAAALCLRPVAHRLYGAPSHSHHVYHPLPQHAQRMGTISVQQQQQQHCSCWEGSGYDEYPAGEFFSTAGSASRGGASLGGAERMSETMRVLLRACAVKMTTTAPEEEADQRLQWAVTSYNCAITAAADSLTELELVCSSSADNLCSSVQALTAAHARFTAMLVVVRLMGAGLTAWEQHVMNVDWQSLRITQEQFLHAVQALGDAAILRTPSAAAAGALWCRCTGSTAGLYALAQALSALKESMDALAAQLDSQTAALSPPRAATRAQKLSGRQHSVYSGSEDVTAAACCGDSGGGSSSSSRNRSRSSDGSGSSSCSRDGGSATTSPDGSSFSIVASNDLSSRCSIDDISTEVMAEPATRTAATFGRLAAQQEAANMGSSGSGAGDTSDNGIRGGDPCTRISDHRQGRRECEQCGATEGKLRTCKGCAQVRYCSTACQIQHWRAQHKKTCSSACMKGPKDCGVAAAGMDA